MGTRTPSKTRLDWQKMKMTTRCITILAAGMALAASAADVTIEKPYFRWLFNGFGFQHSEANFAALMPDDFRDQRVLKTFAELSPTFARVYTGFADQSKEQLDRFADSYDNSVNEAFFKNLKTEELYRRRYSSAKEFKDAVSLYVKFYNEERPHQAIRQRTPARMEELYLRRQKTEADAGPALHGTV